MNAFIQFIYISKSSLLCNELINQFESTCERIYDTWVMISSVASLLISIVLILNLRRDWSNQSSINLYDCTNYLFFTIHSFSNMNCVPCKIWISTKNQSCFIYLRSVDREGAKNALIYHLTLFMENGHRLLYTYDIFCEFNE